MISPIKKTLIDCHLHDISAPTLPSRMRMLLYLRKYPEVHEPLLFGTDYPLSVFHTAARGRVALGPLHRIIKTKNRFDRQVEVCNGLKLGFRPLGDWPPSSPITATH